jgi:hypothetical protein
MSDQIHSIVAEIADERVRQVERWGQQDHPSFLNHPLPRDYGKQADRWKAINDARVETDSLTWDGILLEEVYEALAEEDPIARRIELVQVAAVAAAEIEAIDRRLAAKHCDLGGTCELDCTIDCLLIEAE